MKISNKGNRPFSLAFPRQRALWGVLALAVGFPLIICYQTTIKEAVSSMYDGHVGSHRQLCASK